MANFISFYKSSAWVGDKFYLADMELQGDIRKDDCKCVIKDDEPLITLAKEKRARWRGLLKQRVSWHACDWPRLALSCLHLLTCVHCLSHSILMWLLTLITGRNVKRTAPSRRVRWAALLLGLGAGAVKVG